MIWAVNYTRLLVTRMENRSHRGLRWWFHFWSLAHFKGLERDRGLGLIFSPKLIAVPALDWGIEAATPL